MLEAQFKTRLAWKRVGAVTHNKTHESPNEKTSSSPRPSSLSEQTREAPLAVLQFYGGEGDGRTVWIRGLNARSSRSWKSFPSLRGGGIGGLGTIAVSRRAPVIFLFDSLLVFLCGLCGSARQEVFNGTERYWCGICDGWKSSGWGNGFLTRSLPHWELKKECTRAETQRLRRRVSINHLSDCGPKVFTCRRLEFSSAD
jgi:hypothetical protein